MPDEPIRADQQLSVTLSAQEWNVVLAGLGELPHRIASPVIQKLQEALRAAVAGSGTARE